MNRDNGTDAPPLPHHIDGPGRVFAFSPVCMKCAHWSIVPGIPFPKFHCAGFGEHIPDEIWSGKHGHKTPYEGDHGVRFELQVGPRKSKKHLNGESA